MKSADVALMLLPCILLSGAGMLAARREAHERELAALREAQQRVIAAREAKKQRIAQAKASAAIIKLGPVPGNATKLIIQEIKVGNGAKALPGRQLTTHYTGTLTNGTKFDSSLDRGTPFDFLLGAGHVIQGWDQGLVGMRVGGKRRLIIPPALGYGTAGSPPVIPPNSTLVFTVELLKVE